MLVLTRRIDESVWIQTADGDCKVKVLGVDGRGRVMLGFEVSEDADFGIWREELLPQQPPREPIVL